MPLVTTLRERLPGLVISDDAADRVAYSRDLWPRHHLAVRAGNVAHRRPLAVVWPRTTEDVARIVRFACESDTKLVPFGAGSGVCAGILPREDMLVVDLKHLSRIRRLDTTERVVEVEAGHMGVPFEDAIGAHGLTLGHFPSSILCSTVGGWIAARSAGQCSGKYGKIEDMVLALECVTGTGDVVTLHHRSSGPNLIPLVVGSEGTLAIVTAATLRLHPKPSSRAFSAWTFATMADGWEAMREMFQAGLRPAVARLYDPFDAMLARRGSVAKERSGQLAPGLGTSALRRLLGHPAALNEAIDRLGDRALGGSLLVCIFEGEGERPQRDMEAARRMMRERGARDEGEGPAQRWLAHRYSVSYRQAPVLEGGLFADTIEVAAPWSKLGALYDGVRKALGAHVFVMAHMSHAYPDGCCIYFSFAGTAARGSRGTWDEACEETYDAAWRSAMRAALAAGGTLAHHHGVGRSKAPRLSEELGASGIDAVRALMRAFDPKAILNPGNLIPGADPPHARDAIAQEIA